jgi:hypothetical protein
MLMPRQRARTKNTHSQEDIDVGPLFDYISSDKGHEILTRLLDLIEGLKKATVDTASEQAKNDGKYSHAEKIGFMRLQGFVFGVIVVAGSVLAFYGKFDSTLGFLFGTLVGYFVGKDRIYILTRNQNGHDK